MSILNIAGYRFVHLAELPALKDKLRKHGLQENLKGTILLSHEGINLMLAGARAQVERFLQLLLQDNRFQGMTFRKTFSDFNPFGRFKVKIRQEIITLRSPHIDPVKERAKAIAPETFCQWLDEKRPMTVLDVRNDFEVEVGAFAGAINPKLKSFSEFPKTLKNIPKNLPVVMYCTGGIRCEKAAIAMTNAGFNEVYQLQDGILGYFAAVGGAHFKGNCFVFDERIALNCEGTPIT